jgi:putative ABC transport system ATP-binding protein
MKSDTIKSTENEAIVATGLTKWFGEGETRKTAVNSVTLVAHFGEMLFIVGPSGSGKTTLLSMISGILRPNAGKVVVKGEDIWTLNNDQLADFRLNTIDFVFQDYHLFPQLPRCDRRANRSIKQPADCAEPSDGTVDGERSVDQSAGWQLGCFA